MPQRTCPVCGKAFHVAPSNVALINCCSRTCRYEYQRKHPKPPPAFEKTCACGCGETFMCPQRAPGRIYKRGHGRRNDYYTPRPRKKTKTTLTLTCETCGKQFERSRNNYQGKHTFCGRECAGRSEFIGRPQKRVSVSCSYCSKGLIVHLSKFILNKHFYCNKLCRANHIMGTNNPAYRSGKGRHIYYGQSWKRQRNAALARDGYTCQHCKKRLVKPKQMHVHHITPAYAYSDHNLRNRLSNLITLCYRCHKAAEKGKVIIQRKMF